MRWRFLLRVLQQMNKLIKTEAAVNCCTIAPRRRPRCPPCLPSGWQCQRRRHEINAATGQVDTRSDSSGQEPKDDKGNVHKTLTLTLHCILAAGSRQPAGSAAPTLSLPVSLCQSAYPFLTIFMPRNGLQSSLACR